MRTGFWLAVIILVFVSALLAATIADNIQKDRRIEVLEAQVHVLEGQPEPPVFIIEYQRPGDFFAPDGHEVFTDTEGLPEGLMRIGVRAREIGGDR